MDTETDDFDIEAIFDAANRRQCVEARSEKVTFQDPTDLLGRFSSYQEGHSFKPGDLVTWKVGLRNRLHPSTNQPAVVMAVFPTILSKHKVSNTILSFVPVDIEIGIIDIDDEFMVFAVDSQRFQPWVGDQA